MTADPPGVVLSHFRHDLRTPVNAVLGYADLLLDDADEPLPAELQAGLVNLRDLGHELLAAINGLQPVGEPTQDDVRGVVELARAALRPTTERVVERAARLEEFAGGAGLAAAAQDLGRIRAAGVALHEVLRTAVLAVGGRRSLLEEAKPAADAPRPAEPQAPLHAGHVLVVDDEPTNRHLFARGLYKQGHTFTLAENGTIALDLLASHPFDVVFLDLLMPGLSGLEVLTRIKQSPATGHIPVIVISALDQLDGVVQCLEAGAEDYLPKPCNPVLLKARLGVCLEKKRLRDRELEYLRQVETVTAAAASLEAGTFSPDSLAAAAERPDALGVLARVFGRMAREVQAREDRLRQEVVQLRVEIDQVRKAREVADIAESDYFRHLQDQVQSIRNRRRPDAGAGA